MARKRMVILERTIQCLDCTTKLGAHRPAGIAHYRKRHPNSPENCFQLFNVTWDPNYDRLIKAYSIQLKHAVDLREELNKVIELLKKENREANIAKTKLNGIIMILKSPQEGV